MTLINIMGDLVIYQPEEGSFYMYGQKNYHKPKYSERRFVRTIYTKRGTK